jgi:hypothetical protein
LRRQRPAESHECHQAFFAELAQEDTKQATIDRYRYKIMRFENWLVANGHLAILASLERSILIADRKYLETLPQQPNSLHGIHLPVRPSDRDL